MFNVPSFFGFRSNAFGTPIDPDYQAVLDYATLQGFVLPSASQQILQNQLVVDLKNAGFWSTFDSFSMFATDGDSDFALIDWIRLSDYTAINSPTFVTNSGFLGNGTSSYIDTNFFLATDRVNFQLNDAGMSVYMYQLGTDSKYIVGASSGSTDAFRMRVHSNPSQLIDGQLNSNPFTTSQGILSRQIGHYHVDRLDASSFRYQINSSLGSVYSGASTGIINLPVWVLRITTQYADYGVSYFIIRKGMTQADKNAMNTIINNYLTAI